MTIKIGNIRKINVRWGRDSENNKLLSFLGSDGLNQKSRGYFHKVWWIGPMFVSFVHDEG
jgi:hypothetical protein